MLQRTERIKNQSPDHYARLFAERRETLEQLLERVGAIKVNSYPCTPETRPQPGAQQPPPMQI